MARENDQDLSMLIQEDNSCRRSLYHFLYVLLLHYEKFLLFCIAFLMLALSMTAEVTAIRLDTNAYFLQSRVFFVGNTTELPTKCNVLTSFGLILIWDALYA